MIEADIMRRLMKRATDMGARLFRNNCGVLQDKRGVPVRFGLHPGSGDLVGWVPVTVTQEMVGTTIAVFASVEVKTDKGRARPDQIQWARTVAAAGGYAGIARNDQDLTMILCPSLSLAIGVDKNATGGNTENVPLTRHTPP